MKKEDFEGVWIEKKIIELYNAFFLLRRGLEGELFLD